MRKHPLLAFAATTVGLTFGATTTGAFGASASPQLHHRHHAHHASKTARRHRIAILASSKVRLVQKNSTRFLSTTGPTRFLLPNSASSPVVSTTPKQDKVWASLRACESGGNYREDTGNGFYGAYQFAISSWQRVGESGMPNLAPPAVQDQAALRLMTIQGWRAWPNCSWLLGLA
jgi:hypothetical protein